MLADGFCRFVGGRLSPAAREWLKITAGEAVPAEILKRLLDLSANLIKKCQQPGTKQHVKDKTLMFVLAVAQMVDQAKVTGQDPHDPGSYNTVEVVAANHPISFILKSHPTQRGTILRQEFANSGTPRIKLKPIREKINVVVETGRICQGDDPVAQGREVGARLQPVVVSPGAVLAGPFGDGSDGPHVGPADRHHDVVRLSRL